MLRAYGPRCDGTLVEAAHGNVPDTATWIDLEEPTHDEEKLVEKLVGVPVPTRDELREIEPSSRLYEQNGALYLTLSTLCGVEEGNPTSEPIGFVLTDKRLVTVRYATPKPIRAFMNHVHRDGDLARDAMTVLVRLLDAIIDRLADELEGSGAEMEAISSLIFARQTDERRIPARALTGLLSRIGRAHALLGRIRETTVSAIRLLSFLSGSEPMHRTDHNGAREHIVSLQADATALLDHAGYLGDDLNFVMDAALGLISVEQNAAMKLFSWAALVFLPPALIAGIFGMNFKNMPVLDLTYGFPLALLAIVLSAVLPVAFLRWRGWI